MQPETTLFLLDFDHTLFNPEPLKQSVSKQLVKLVHDRLLIERFWQLERQMRGKPHYLVETIQTFCDEINRLELIEKIFDLFLTYRFMKDVYKDVSDFLQQLKPHGKMIVFTQGDETYQQVKVQQSQILQQVDGVYVFAEKLPHLADIVKYSGAQSIHLFDDNPEIITNAKRAFPDLTTIWVNRRDRPWPEGIAKPDSTIRKLTEFSIE